MDIAYIIEKLVPKAKYYGVANQSDKSTYDKLQWVDVRPKPLWTDIENYKLIDANEDKKIKVQNIKDIIIKDVDWIFIRMTKDEMATKLGIIAKIDEKYNDQDKIDYLNWTKKMNDLYKSVNYDLLNIDDITINNTTLFPVCPFDRKTGNRI